MVFFDSKSVRRITVNENGHDDTSPIPPHFHKSSLICKGHKETAALIFKAAVSNGHVKMAAARRLFSFAVVRQITLLFFYFVEIFFQAKPLFVHFRSCFYSHSLTNVLPHLFFPLITAIFRKLFLVILRFSLYYLHFRT